MRKILPVLLLSLFAHSAYAQTKWELKKENDGIKVYTAITPNSPFRSVKVDCILDASCSQLIAMLLDVEKQPEWVFNTKTTRLLQKVKPNEVIFYAEVSVPWPCANRDYVAHFTINQLSQEHVVIESHAEASYLAEKDGIIRVKKSSGRLEAYNINKDQIRLTYTVSFDPAGSIPAWLTNMFVTKGPYETFKKLRVGLNKPEYQNAHFDFATTQ
jgi:hypothetical protein